MPLPILQICPSYGLQKTAIQNDREQIKHDYDLENISNKKDIELLELNIKRDIRELEVKLTHNSELLRVELKRDIAESKADLQRWIITVVFGTAILQTAIIAALVLKLAGIFKQCARMGRTR